MSQMINTRFMATFTPMCEGDIIIKQDDEHGNWIQIYKKDKPDEKIMLNNEDDLDEFITLLQTFKNIMNEK